MSNTSSILIYGSDEQLLRTRQWVLQASGYRVWTAMHFDEVERTISEQPIDLVIFCYSLSPAAYERALASVMEKRPSVHVLVMAAAGVDGRSKHDGEQLEPLAGPVKLVAAVDKLMRCHDIPAATTLSS